MERINSNRENSGSVTRRSLLSRLSALLALGAVPVAASAAPAAKPRKMSPEEQDAFVKRVVDETLEKHGLRFDAEKVYRLGRRAEELARQPALATDAEDERRV